MFPRHLASHVAASLAIGTTGPPAAPPVPDLPPVDGGGTGVPPVPRVPPLDEPPVDDPAAEVPPVAPVMPAAPLVPAVGLAPAVPPVAGAPPEPLVCTSVRGGSGAFVLVMSPHAPANTQQPASTTA